MATREEYVAPDCFVLSFQVEESVNKRISAFVPEDGIGDDVIEEGGDDE